MTAKLANIQELYNLLKEKEHVCHDIMNLFGLFGLGHTLRRLKQEKREGIPALQIIISLCLFRFYSESVYSMYKNKFHGLLDTGKNCYYRLLNREKMDWRKVLLRMSVRFFAILT